MSPQPPALHPDLVPLAFLLGKWRGEGRGLWRADPPFRYAEEVEFGHVGRPFLAYRQRTWAADDGRPMHAEAGYLRPGQGGRVELVLAQPTGLTEVQVGPLDGRRLTLRAAAIGRSPTALNVTAIERQVWMEGDTLHYLVRIAMNDEPLAAHLAATLRRVG